MTVPERVRRTWATPLMAGAVVYAATLVSLHSSRRVVLLSATFAAATSLLSRRPVLLLALPTLAMGVLNPPVALVDPWMPTGPVVELTLTTDPVESPFGATAFARVDESTEVRLRFDDTPSLQRGDRVAVRGSTDGVTRVVRGRTVAGTLDVREVVWTGPPRDPLLRSANLLRSHLLDNLAIESDQGRALLAGFLIGDVSEVDDLVLEDLRRSGLSHLVAVSGSNVALFLVLWWVVTGPLSVSPRLRGLIGCVGLVLFGHLTRWEPSVVRASAMAGLVLVGRSVGLVVEGWSALSAAVIGALWLAPHLAVSIGFQLSVAATIGILAAPRTTEHAVVRAALITGCAQLAVTPILLTAFGSVPLFSPLANLVAIPVVGAATVVGGIGSILGLTPLVTLAALGADLVIAVGRIASHWPQVGWPGMLLTLVGLAGALLRPVLRPWLALVVAAVLAASVVPIGLGMPARPSVVFLDVGQGDAALVLGQAVTVLIDGGPDPAVLDRKLERFGVDQLDLLVVTHVHADHVDGLGAVVGRRPVGVVWEAMAPHSSPAAERFLRSLDDTGIPRSRPAIGARVAVGDVTIEVLGPQRRYASPNDQSLVLLVEIDGTRILFPGDIETFAQGELSVSGVDVLKVPHQGAATSLPDWLTDHAGSLAVISVGPNDFGHPSDDVVSTLSTAGALVCRTDVDGDVSVRPGRLAACDR